MVRLSCGVLLVLQMTSRYPLEIGLKAVMFFVNTGLMGSIIRPMRILVVDDVDLERAVIRTLLEQQGYQVVDVQSGSEALQEFVDAVQHEQPFDMVFMDFIMPDMDGIETVKQIRRRCPKHWTPVLFLSSLEDEQRVCHALESGADDFLTKPISEKLLLAKISAFSRVKQLHQELETMNLELFHSSITDPLTQVHNRLGFLNQYEVQWRISSREQQSMSVIMADVDHFKEFNDTYGHLEGDRCLREIAQALVVALKRPGDLLGRFGGEEFIAMLPSTEVRGALRVGEQMREAVSNLRISNASGANTQSPFVTISVGVSTAEHVRLCHSEDLIRSADDALYAAKGAGRNRVSFVNCTPNSQLVGSQSPSSAQSSPHPPQSSNSSTNTRRTAVGHHQLVDPKGQGQSPLNKDDFELPTGGDV